MDDPANISIPSLFSSSPINSTEENNLPSPRIDIDQFFNDSNQPPSKADHSFQRILKMFLKSKNEACLQKIDSTPQISGEFYETFDWEKSSDPYNSVTSTYIPSILDCNSQGEQRSQIELDDELKLQKKRRIFTISRHYHVSNNVSENILNITSNPKNKTAFDQNSDGNDITILIKPLPSESDQLKGYQNPKKNLPGLIMQRVNKSCWAYLNQQKKKLRVEKTERIEYIIQILGEYSEEDAQGLGKFIKAYNRKGKTWVSNEKYLMSNKALGRLLLRIVGVFLSSEGSRDFDDWILMGRMSEKNKQEILRCKEWFKGNFRELARKIDSLIDLEKI